MKNLRNLVWGSGLVIVAAWMLAGCSTPTIPIKMKVAGEYKLTGVSKIALMDFNSFPDDPFTGVLAADKETCALTKRMVESAFYKTKCYQVVDMNLEKMINAQEKAHPDKRFDAVIYGRLWWQMTDPVDGQYPKVYTLEEWVNKPYLVKDVLTGQESTKISHVTTLQKDVLKMLNYRMQNATLMVTLSIYRLNGNGGISKIIDTYQVSDCGFVLKNGVMEAKPAEVGTRNDSAVARMQDTGKEETAVAKSLFSLGSQLKQSVAAVTESKDEKKEEPDQDLDANGKIRLVQKTLAIPTELQAKLMLASRISSSLSAKIAPSEVNFDVLADFSDQKLLHLLQNGAYSAAVRYIGFMLRTHLGKQNIAKIPAMEMVPAGDYLVPESDPAFENDEELKAFIADEGFDHYFYALGICQEATRDIEAALQTYRYAFELKSTKSSAMGISRCLLALGQEARVKETQKAMKKASKKTDLK